MIERTKAPEQRDEAWLRAKRVEHRVAIKPRALAGNSCLFALRPALLQRLLRLGVRARVALVVSGTKRRD
jgi:hypothetical protein